MSALCQCPNHPTQSSNSLEVNGPACSPLPAVGLDETRKTEAVADNLVQSPPSVCVPGAAAPKLNTDPFRFLIKAARDVLDDAVSQERAGELSDRFRHFAQSLEKQANIGVSSKAIQSRPTMHAPGLAPSAAPYRSLMKAAEAYRLGAWTSQAPDVIVPSSP